MGPSPGPAWAQPGPIHFSRDRARNFEKGPSSTQARDRFFEKGLENWDFYVVKKEARQGSGSNFCEGPRLGLGSRLIFKARDQPGIDFLGLDPSLVYEVQIRSIELPFQVLIRNWITQSNVWLYGHVMMSLESFKLVKSFRSMITKKADILE